LKLIYIESVLSILIICIVFRFERSERCMVSGDSLGRLVLRIIEHCMLYSDSFLEVPPDRTHKVENVAKNSCKKWRQKYIKIKQFV